PREYVVVIKAMSQVTTGQYSNTLRIVEDDPAPTLTFTASRGRVVEGGTLRFTVALSEPVGTDLWYSLRFEESPRLPTLWTDDVTEEFLLAQLGWVPDPPVPLWESLAYSLTIPAGSTTADFEIPTVRDDVAEDREVILVTIEAWEDPLLPEPITVRGVVRDG
ncbi:MAG: putative secreted protein, partial [Acidobacteria bacterium]|nr:putative secreted protein [Acidobacteriota bacterium]